MRDSLELSLPSKWFVRNVFRYNMRECVNKKKMKTCFFIAVFDEGDPLRGRYLPRFPAQVLTYQNLHSLLKSLFGVVNLVVKLMIT